MRHPDIERVEDWNLTWVDIETGMPIMGAATGSNPAYRNAVQRMIQNIYGKEIHKGCGGTWDIINGECGCFQVRMKCRTCGHEICGDY